MPPRKLTAEQAKFVQDAGHDMFTYEEAAEHHTAILRKIPINEYAAAYEQCAKIAAPMGFRPDQHNLAKCVADSKSALAKECTTPIEHIQAMSAAMFLAQTIGAQAADFHGKYLLPEVMKVRTELIEQNPPTPNAADLAWPLPATLHPALAAALPAPAASPHSPPRIPPIRVSAHHHLPRLRLRALRLLSPRPRHTRADCGLEAHPGAAARRDICHGRRRRGGGGVCPPLLHASPGWGGQRDGGEGVYLLCSCRR
ncbi:hypothetical protein DFH09DRAFT_192784 [Mycena vulgaris]|nr:hypothetical protein DFH09DRAFT_192784 [Mycena vulgaris]